jgi:hypothetical protein
MVDGLTRSMRASHVLVGILVTASLIFAAVGAAMNDTFYLRLATEALIYAGLALSVDSCSATPACCRSARRYFSAWVRICPRSC